MTSAIIIALCVLLLAAYFFDLTASKTRIPSVILLLALGILFKHLTIFFGFEPVDLTNILPVTGTVGLILIVLEGAMDLEINRNRLTLVKKSFLQAVLPMALFCAAAAVILNYNAAYDLRTSLLNAIPLAVISSAVAIPSVKNLKRVEREFVTYETSFSDILGVVFFNYLLVNSASGLAGFGDFSLQVIAVILLSPIAALMLMLFLRRIEHHIKYIPMMVLIILTYTLFKEIHLPALIYILLLGLFLGNIGSLKKMKMLRYFRPDLIEAETERFREIVVEGTFIIRTLFFIMFGYIIDVAELFNTSTLIWAFGLSFLMFLIRWISLKALRIPVYPFLFVAPRGLITVLLFVSLPAQYAMETVNRPLIIQVIFICIIVMMIGTMQGKKKHGEDDDDSCHKSTCL